MRLIILALVGALTASQALAHGKLQPAHGGVIVEGPRTTVELVVTPVATTVYLSDHGKTLASSGSRADVVLLQAGKKTELPLTAGPGNTLTGPGATVTTGAKAMLRLQRPGQPLEQIRLSLP